MDARERERHAYLLASLAQARAGTSVISRLDQRPVTALLELSEEDLVFGLGLRRAAARAVQAVRGRFDPEALLRSIEGVGACAITPADPGYPAGLHAMPDPPPALYVRGGLPGEGAGGVCVALVGSRKATAGAVEAARRIGRRLAERGVGVVSGLAVGVDAAAHEGALEAGSPGCATVAVLGSGIDVIYPRSNRSLYRRCVAEGAVVSEYAPGEPALPWRFPARNRIIAGLAEAVVVVEAAERSGALITARHAAEGGREVWAVPGPMGAAECRGSNRLLADGAAVLWDVDDFVDAVAPGVAPGVAGGEVSEQLVLPEVLDGLPPGEEVALQGVGFEPAPADVVARRCGVRMPELLPALAILELKGYVGRDESGAFVRRAVR